MEKNQKIALDLWLGTATLFNDFKPCTDRDLCIELGHLDIEVTKSTIARWREKFDFAGHLQNKISASMVTDATTRELIAKSASDAVIEKTIVDIERNGKLSGLAYSILEAKAEMIMLKYETTKIVSDNDAKIAVQIAQLTTGREDRMLDRAAMLDTAKMISKEDILAGFDSLAVDVEIE
jgi:hypothetical protein